LVQGATTFTASGTSVTAAATYTARSQSATSGTGTGAVFTIAKTGSGAVYSDNITVTITNGGSNYAVGDTITILGTNLGGTSPTNDLTLTVATRATAYPGVIQSVTSGAGADAVFTITKTGSSANYSGNTTVTMTKYGTGYAIGDTITILGTSLGGTAPTNNLTLTITDIGPTLLDDGSTVNLMSLVEESFTAQERIKTFWCSQPRKDIRLSVGV
jgi:hypothetical protein